MVEVRPVSELPGSELPCCYSLSLELDLPGFVLELTALEPPDF